jgi:hypothetical protein
MEVDGELHVPAVLPPGKELPVPIEQEAGWAPRAGLSAVEKRKLSCPCRDLNPGSPAGSPSL